MLHVCVSAALYRAPPTVEATRSPPSGTCAPSGATTATEDTLITFSDREDNKDTIGNTNW